MSVASARERLKDQLPRGDRIASLMQQPAAALSRKELASLLNGSSHLAIPRLGNWSRRNSIVWVSEVPHCRSRCAGGSIDRPPPRAKVANLLPILLMDPFEAASVRNGLRADLLSRFAA